MRVKQIPLSVKFFIGLCLAMAFSARADNLIQNGSFENPVQDGVGAYQGVIPTGWAYNTFGIEHLDNGNVANTPGPDDGDQFVKLYNKAGLNQSINIPEAGKYLMTIEASGTALNSKGILLAYMTKIRRKPC